MATLAVFPTDAVVIRVGYFAAEDRVKYKFQCTAIWLGCMIPYIDYLVIGLLKS